MPSNLTALIYVLAIAAIVFRLAKPIALHFSAPGDFSRRCKVWFVLTVIAFVSPSIWLFMLIAVPLFMWAGRKDTNPAAVYLLLLHVVPPVSVIIPVLGNNGLFPLDNYRLLCFCVLIPTLWRLRQSRDTTRIRGLHAMDFVLLSYGVVQTLRYIPPDFPGSAIIPDSPTNLLRRAVLFLIDVYIPYFAISRSCSTRRALTEAQAAFCLSCGLMAAIAIFESARHWLVYVEISQRWSSDVLASLYLPRGGTIRAEASAGHPLALGFLLAIAFGFWLHLQTSLKERWPRVAVVALLLAGLIAAYSRGPWIGAVVIYFVFAVLSPRALPTLMRAAGMALLVAAGLSVSPIGERITNVLPFMGGSVDIGNAVYRQRLAERSWKLFQDHPYVGDSFVLSKMQDLRQGQGIIDLVNSYAGVALFYGLAGLIPFLIFILAALLGTHRVAKRMARSDPEFASLGISLAACIVGMLVMIENCSFIFGTEKMFYVLAALAAAYAHLGRSPKRSSAVSSAPLHAAPDPR